MAMRIMVTMVRMMKMVIMMRVMMMMTMKVKWMRGKSLQGRRRAEGDGSSTRQSGMLGCQRG